MKTLGRVLIILTAFVIVMGTTYFTVNAGGSSSTSVPAFERGGGEGFTPNGERPESRGVGSSGFGLMFGMLKNMIIVAVIVALIVFPKNLLQQRCRAVPVRIK